MSKAKKKRLAIALAVASTAAMLTGCGSGNSGNGIGGTGSGLYGNCIPITGYSNYGAPQLASNAILFTGNNVRVNTASIVAGMIPPISPSPCAGQNNGQVVATGSFPLPNGTLAPEQLSVFGSYDGDLTMTVGGYVPTNGTGGYGCTETGRASITGKLRISPQTQDEIVRDVMSGIIPVNGYNPTAGYNPGYNPGYSPNPFGPSTLPYNPAYGQPYGNAAVPQVCVSSVALDMGYLRDQLFGVVYLYLNNSTHGIKLQL